ncbi:hypothetical protein DFQ26_008897, partial [Actinomortierella ambigua]
SWSSHSPNFTTAFYLSSTCGLRGEQLGRELGYNGFDLYLWCREPSSNYAVHYLTWPIKSPNTLQLDQATKFPSALFNESTFLTFLPAPARRVENDTTAHGGWRFPWALILHVNGQLYALDQSSPPSSDTTTWIDEGRPIAINVDKLFMATFTGTFSATIAPTVAWPTPTSYDYDNDINIMASLGPVLLVAFFIIAVGLFVRHRKAMKRNQTPSESPSQTPARPPQPPSPPRREAVYGTQRPSQRPPSITSCHSLPPYTERPSSRDWPRDEHEEYEMQTVQ